MLIISDSDPKGLKESIQFLGFWSWFFSLESSCWSKPKSESCTSWRQERSSNIRGMILFFSTSLKSPCSKFFGPSCAPLPLPSVDPELLNTQSFPWEFFQARKLAMLRQQLGRQATRRVASKSGQQLQGRLTAEIDRSEELPCFNQQVQPRSQEATILVGATFEDNSVFEAFRVLMSEASYFQLAFSANNRSKNRAE